MYISFNEFRVLRTLSDGEQHDKAPKGLTEILFPVACSIIPLTKLAHPPPFVGKLTFKI